MAAPAAVLSILVKANTSGATRGLLRFNSSLGATEARSNKALGAVKTFAKGSALATGVGLGYAVKKAADFEQQLDSLGSVSGATGRDMERFRKQAMKAGADTKFSALDAAAAQTELAKGGLSVRNILRGGLRSALALAAAGEMELAEAASTTANAMNLFGLRGKDSIKVADALAKAANATTADVSDFAMALTQGGGVAKTAGLSFQQTVLALEALAKAGTRNSDAGTSLKTSIIQLLKPTAKQAALAKELGLNFVDSAGNMKSMSDISDMLRDKLGGMTRAQRIATLATLAGTDGVRTLTALYDAGPDKLDRWSRGLNESGTAAEVAAQKQDNLKGKLENLQGSVETVAIAIGTKLLPALTKAAEDVTKVLNDPKLTSAEKFQRLANMLSKAFSDLLPKVAEFGAKAGVTFVRAMFDAFRNSGLLAKLVIGGFLFSKLGGFRAFQNVGNQAGEAMAKGTATTFAGRMRSRMAGIGKAIGVGLLFSGMADAISRDDISGFGDRLGTFISTATLGAFPAPETITEKLNKAVAAAQTGGDIRQEGWDKFWSGISSSLDDQGKKVIVKLREVRERATQVFGPDTKLQISPELNPTQALAAMGTLSLNLGKLNNTFDRFGNNTSQVRKLVDQNLVLIGKTLGFNTKAGAQTVRENMRAASRAIVDNMGRGRTSVKEGMAAIRKAAIVNSQAVAGTTNKNFTAARDAIRDAIAAGIVSSETGLAEIQRLWAAEFRLLGYSPKEAQSLLKARKDRGRRGSHFNVTPQYGPGAQTGRQLRGMTVPGQGSGDKVHMSAMVEPGEKVFVLNRNASRALHGLQKLNRAVPRFQGGGTIPRVMATGNLGSGALRGLVQTGLDRTRSAANDKLRDALDTLAASAGVPGRFKGGTYKWANQIARLFGLSVGSGYRTPEHNAAVGGVPNSLHTHGTVKNPGAIDLNGSVGAMNEASQWAAKNIPGLQENLIHDVGSGLHLHLGFFKKGGLLKRMAKGGALVAAQAARKAGFRGGLLNKMIAIAGGESGWNPGAHNTVGEDSRGLWQINVGPNANTDLAGMKLFDPFVNARAAKIVYDRQGLDAWTIYTNGEWQQFTDEARRALLATRGGRRAAAKVRGKVTKPKNLGSAFGPNVKGKHGGGLTGGKGPPAVPFGGMHNIPPSEEEQDALAEALQAVADAMAEISAQNANVAEQLRQQTNFARGAITSQNAQAWKALADILSGQLGPVVALNSQSAGTPTQLARY